MHLARMHAGKLISDLLTSRFSGRTSFAQGDRFGRQHMFIQTLTPPVSGEDFRFSVAGCSGITKVRVLVNSQPIYRNTYESMLCRSLVTIPPGVGGKTLSISAEDSAGHSKKIDYEISKADPGAHSMLSF